jgi:cytosine/adenosine deaminase-related metal-dependent hydrolase
LFDASGFLAEGGQFGIGSDSLIRISAADELRTLEYGQRLKHRQRNVLGEATRSTGRRLFEAALAGGARATDEMTAGGISAGKRADFVVLDRHHPALAAAQGDSLIDAWLFAADNTAIKSVYCRGVPVVQNGRHVARDELSQRYLKALIGLA